MCKSKEWARQFCVREEVDGFLVFASEGGKVGSVGKSLRGLFQLGLLPEGLAEKPLGLLRAGLADQQVEFLPERRALPALSGLRTPNDCPAPIPQLLFL
jgi:hypothetical protein